jgi:hypothetical protein
LTGAFVLAPFALDDAGLDAGLEALLDAEPCAGAADFGAAGALVANAAAVRDRIPEAARVTSFFMTFTPCLPLGS